MNLVSNLVLNQENQDKGIKHKVFSRTLNFKSSDEVELVKENPVDYITKLKSMDYKKIWLCGGSRLADTLLENELLETLKLKVNPTIGGSGLRLFGESKKNLKLGLMDLKKYDSGVILTTYKIIY